MFIWTLESNGNNNKKKGKVVIESLYLIIILQKFYNWRTLALSQDGKSKCSHISWIIMFAQAYSMPPAYHAEI